MTTHDPAQQEALNQTIGAALREARLARGVTQEELARSFGVDRVTIARYERGTRTISAPMLLRMLAFLGRDVQLDGGQAAYSGVPASHTEPRDPMVERIVRLLYERPELVATVTDLFETLELWPTSEPDEMTP